MERVRRSDFVGARRQQSTASEGSEPLVDGFDPPLASPSESEPAAVGRNRRRVFERKPAIAYAGVENADVYQRIMRVLFENKRVLGARLNGGRDRRSALAGSR